MSLVRMNACTDCLTFAITDPNCVCCWGNKYETIELEFEECKCCGNISEEYADTEFNHSQLKKLQ